MTTKALIYCRVSSQRQVDEGNGLSSQEQRCRVYCQNKGYSIDKIFSDAAVSGKLFERPAMHDLLQYVDNHSSEEFVVVFDDLSRFSRDMEVQLRLRTEFQSRGLKRECLNFTFDETPESEYAELVLTAGNQYQRQSNRRQVIQKQKARLEKGYWAFCTPRALENQKHPLHGKILVRKEPHASIYKEGIEKFRDGILPSILDFQSFVNEKYKEQDIRLRISSSTAKSILKQILYAGYLEYPKWEVPRMKGQHEGFITIETYDAAQERLQGRSKPWHRKDYNLDFPLRPHVLCDSCGVPMSGAFNTGRKGIRYPHYYCRGEGCRYIWKTIPKDKFESQFEALISSVKPADEWIDLTKDMLRIEWNNRLENYSSNRDNIQDELKDIEEQINDFAEMAGKAGRAGEQALVDVYEGKIKELDVRKKGLEKKLTENNYSNKDFGTAADKVLNTLKKPLDMWQSDEYNDKRTILFMYFEDKLTYDYNSGFGTTNLAYPINLINKNHPLRSGSVEMSGYEPESKKTF